MVFSRGVRTLAGFQYRFFFLSGEAAPRSFIDLTSGLASLSRRTINGPNAGYPGLFITIFS